MTELPHRFGVIGSGAIGCEMTQAFSRFGSEVTIFSRSGTILSREDPEAAEVVAKQFEDEGIIMQNHVHYRRYISVIL